MQAIQRATGGPVLAGRTARWAHEADLEEGEERFGAEHNPTENPIGGGKGYSEVFGEGDYTVRSYEEMEGALAEAKAGQVVFLPADAGVDMGGRVPLAVPEGVTLAGDRGREGSPGGLLFSDVLDTPGMLASGGDCARITGLRVRGPYPHRERAAHSSNGIGAAHFGLEIDNCEISGFSVAATRFGPGASRGYVHHNFIHHNQKGGLGYGVSVNGGEALVEANLFDFCRHHIASSGAPGSGYEARYNVCREHANGHLFDMHGGRDRGDGTDIAGDWMDVHHNTFLAVDVRSVVIRGVPSQGARIHHNWCYSPDPDNVVRASGNTRAFRNVLGPGRELVEKLEVGA